MYVEPADDVWFCLQDAEMQNQDDNKKKIWLKLKYPNAFSFFLVFSSLSNIIKDVYYFFF